MIFVNERLDRESQNRYVLTVLAKNRGSIRGEDIDEAQVIIQVEDGNDPPVFRRDFYLADVSEVRNRKTSAFGSPFFHRLMTFALFYCLVRFWAISAIG